MIQAVIFDIGGVLIRTIDQSGRQRLEAQYGLPPGGAEFLVFNSEEGKAAQRGVYSDEENWQRVGRELKLSAEALADFQREFWSGEWLDTTLVDYVRQLRGRYRTGIISNALPGLMTLLTGKYPIADAFDVIVGSGDEGMAKPDPAIYHLALTRLGCQPGEAIFIDDAPRNIEAARSLGMHAVHFQAGMDVPAALAGYGVTV